MRLQHAWSVVLLVGCIHHGVLAGPNDERPSAPALEFGNDDQIVLPYFLRGKPEDQQVSVDCVKGLPTLAFEISLFLGGRMPTPLRWRTVPL